MPPRRKLLQTAPPQGDKAVAAICAVVRRIPKGWVATYGQVAAMAGLPKRARLVGHVLQRLDPATNIPWHRVVNAKGEVSYTLSRNGGDAFQQRLLETCCRINIRHTLRHELSHQASQTGVHL